MKTKSKRDYTIGIDLGGTKLASGLVDANGKLIAEARKPTTPPDGNAKTPQSHVKYVISVMASAVDELVSQIPGKNKAEKLKLLHSVGLASAGPMNVLQGKIIDPPNFPGWKTVPIVSLLEKEIAKRGVKKKVYFQNDAIAAALGEGWVGGAKGLQTYAMVTLGTGIGSGVILNGQPAQSGGMGSEWGHSLVDINVIEKIKPGAKLATSDFYHSTVEGLASGTGMRTLTGKEPRVLADLARRGDKDAREVFARASCALAGLFFNLSLGFHVEKILLTGGLIHIEDVFVPQAIELYNQLITSQAPSFKTKIVRAKMDNSAGVVGAARLGRLG
jgi:glucokinase